MTQIIEQFLQERKESWLKSKKTINEETLQEANSKFSPAEWIQDASERVKQLHIVSHAAKFSNQYAKNVSAIVADGDKSTDGYIRTGNVDYQLDVSGNAAVIDKYKFLCLRLSNGLTVLEAFELSDPLLQSYIIRSGLQFSDIAKSFLQIKSDIDRYATSSLVKQVFFPIGQGQYHLLSILNSGGLMSVLKHRLEEAKDTFFNESKLLENNKVDQITYDIYFDLVKIGFGGNKPQNISFINNAEQGKFYLLPSMPPSLDPEYVRLPKSDFFDQVLYAKEAQIECILTSLDKLIKCDVNNVNVRKGIRQCIDSLIDEILLRAQALQCMEPGWSDKPEITLPLYQKKWLDKAYSEDAEQDQTWKLMMAERIARWIISAYENTIKDAEVFGDPEFEMIKKYVAEQEF